MTDYLQKLKLKTFNSINTLRKYPKTHITSFHFQFSNVLNTLIYALLPDTQNNPKINQKKKKIIFGIEKK